MSVRPAVRPAAVSWNRRRALAASAAAIPLFGAVAGCQSSSLFAGQDPLGGPPPLARDTVTLQDAISAERALISLYKSILPNDPSSSARGRLLAPILAHHTEHLAQLTARLVIPPGASGSAVSASAPPAATPTSAPTVKALRAAELQSCAAMLTRLSGVPAGLAQLFASIAACDATHAAALAGATA